jgi:8-hydroxy-5-deazaflavin:NADPH oxidoreductase
MDFAPGPDHYFRSNSDQGKEPPMMTTASKTTLGTGTSRGDGSALAGEAPGLGGKGRGHKLSIGVVGAGGLGGTLARQLASLGYEVLISNSRGPASLSGLAAEIGATPALVTEAATGSDIVVVSIPTKAITDLPRGLFADVPDSVMVIDTCNYHPELRDGRIDAIDRGMPDSEWVARQLGRPVVKAFNNIFASSLSEKSAPTGAAGRVALPVAGDQPDAKAAVLRLVDELGFDPIDAGGLSESWRQQPGAPAYCRDLDAAAVRCALAEAERSRVAGYRVQEETRIRESMAAQQAKTVK